MSEKTEKRPEIEDGKDIAESLRLRADPPRVMRLSRRTLMVLGTVGGLGLGAILIVALQDREPVDGPQELYSTERIQEAEGLSRLPADYTDVPQLGPPLPGELGRPILSAQQRGEPVPSPVVTTPVADPEEQRRAQEMEAARLSQLFADANTTVREPSPTTQVAAAPPTAESFFPANTASAAPDATERIRSVDCSTTSVT